MQERLTELRRTVYLLHYQFIERMRQEGLDGGGIQDKVYGKGVELESSGAAFPELIRVHHPRSSEPPQLRMDLYREAS